MSELPTMSSADEPERRDVPEMRAVADSKTLGQYLMAVRSETYAHPKVNFERVATVWSGLTGRTFSAYEVGLMLLGLKLARLVTGHHEDSLDDIEGYVECLRSLND